MDEESKYIKFKEEETHSGNYLNFLQYVINKNQAIGVCNECSLHDLALLISNNEKQDILKITQKLKPNILKVPTIKLPNDIQTFDMSNAEHHPSWNIFLKHRIIPIRNIKNYFAIYESQQGNKGLKSWSHGLFIGLVVDFAIPIGVCLNETPAIPIYTINPLILHKHIPTLKDLCITFFA